MGVTHIVYWAGHNDIEDCSCDDYLDGSAFEQVVDDLTLSFFTLWWNGLKKAFPKHSQSIQIFQKSIG